MLIAYDAFVKKRMVELLHNHQDVMLAGRRATRPSAHRTARKEAHLKGLRGPLYVLWHGVLAEEQPCSWMEINDIRSA
ncbi:hypothetical protein AWU65_12010 [Paenibacillus glucanolyticus]|uniref:Uncharacterized protein n=1 Tax=Paenibacillus glucanolyticus TaxID=59843 RepID=A0A163JHP0_9BACL|nr:hypothetical protein [Paenibacillus glucanolyticus]KZS46589.1 hypothetical protein AWU65_12010 [Paenibacillus glucanolyticus]